MLVIAAVALACLSAFGGGAAAARDLTGARVAVPARGVYLGAYVQASNPGAALDAVLRFEVSVRHRLSIDNHFHSWAQPFPTALLSADRSLGRIPMITWKAPSLDSILSGSEDALIASHAATVREFGTPLFIRWGWEMNGYWTEWSGVQNNSAGRHDGPSKYVLAWRRIHDIFERLGATNVSWVWAPNGLSVPNVSWNRAGAYYPGDGYVDWIGISAYNWGTTRPWSNWEPFATLVRRFYQAYSARKPIMVAETASATAGGDKARWITAVGPALRLQYPAIKAVLFFERPPEWSVRSSRRALAAFRSLAAMDVFRAEP